MKTEVIKIMPDEKEKLRKAAALIRNGEIVGIPTETVYGLAANAFDEAAVRKIFEAKGRPQDNPLIVHISDLSQLDELVSCIPDSAVKLAQHFMPGPLTIVLPKSNRIPDAVSAGLPSVAVRMPVHETARAFIDACGVPLAAPSANLSGSPSPTTAQHVLADLDGRIPLIIDGGECSVGVESTVISLTGDIPELLRPGGITLEMLEDVLGEVKVNPAVTAPLEKGVKAKSPGMKYKHYSPKTSVIILKGSIAKFIQYVNERKERNICALVCEEDSDKLSVPYVTYGKKSDLSSQAHGLFGALRAIDSLGKDICYAQCPAEGDIGLAVMNRLLRAAAFRVIDLNEGFIKVALTGKTGSGKSTVSGLLRKKGAAVVDCDIAAREVVDSNISLLTELSDAFGKDILKDGVLDRHLLASRAFADSESTEKLNSITHPYITDYVNSRVSEIRSSGAKVVILDGAALIESGLADECDIIAVSYAPEKIRLERILSRDGISRTDALLRINAQKDDSFYNSRADYIIHNYSPYDLESELSPLISSLGLK